MAILHRYEEIENGTDDQVGMRKLYHWLFRSRAANREETQDLGKEASGQTKAPPDPTSECGPRMRWSISWTSHCHGIMRQGIKSQ